MSNKEQKALDAAFWVIMALAAIVVVFNIFR
jgi:hypothetical protein